MEIGWGLTWRRMVSVRTTLSMNECLPIFQITHVEGTAQLFNYPRTVTVAGTGYGVDYDNYDLSRFIRKDNCLSQVLEFFFFLLGWLESKAKEFTQLRNLTNSWDGRIRIHAISTAEDCAITDIDVDRTENEIQHCIRIMCFKYSSNIQSMSYY